MHWRDQNKLNRDVNSAQSAHFRTGRMRNNPTKGWKREWLKCSSYCEKRATVGWRFIGRWAARICIDFLEGHKSFVTKSTSTIHKSCAAWSNHPRKQRSIADENTSQKFSSAKSLCREIWGPISGRDRKTRALSRRSGNLSSISVSSKKRKKLHSIRFPMSGVLLAASTVLPEERVCDGLWSTRAYGKQERP